MEKNIRNKNKIIGGVAFKVSENYNINPWFLRIIFIVSSLFFYLPIVVYLIMWIDPNVKKANEKRSKKELLGALIGGILGSIILGGIVYIDVTYANYDPSGALGVVFASFFGFLIGIPVGFALTRFIIKSKFFKK